jgi:hypothetical protein
MDFQTLLILAFFFILLPIILIVLILVIRGMRRTDMENKKQIVEEGEKPGPSQLQQSTNLESVARFWYDPVRGNPVVEIDDQMFRKAGDLSLEQYRRLVDSLEDIRQWLGIPSQESAPVRSMPETSEQIDAPSQPPQEPGRITPTPTPETSSLEQEAHFQETRRESMSGGMSGEPVPASMSPINVFARALLPRSETQTPNLNVVAQINAILQEKLEDTPLKQRGIRLVEQPDHSMVVMIGLKKYESVEDVPDEQVKTVIRQAVSEWEDNMLSDES